MDDDIRRIAVVVRKMLGAPERDFGPERQCDLGDFGVVRRNDDVIEQAAFQRRRDGPSDHRAAAERPDILPRNALAATPRRNDCDVHPVMTRSTSAMTFCCSSSLR